MTNDRWHFRCKTCGAYGDGNQDIVDYFVGLHDQAHDIEMWERGKRENS